MLFRIRVLQEGENVAALSLDAGNAEEAARLAKAQGHAVLSVRPQVAWSGLAAPSLHFKSGFQLSLFSQELLALLAAGLNLVEALEILAQKEQRNGQRNVLQGLLALLYEGRPLSYALQQYPHAFPALYVASVRASERTGDIGEALTRYIAYQTQVDAVRKRVVSAAIYPALLLAAGTAVTLFLLLYVVPKFSRIYADIGHELPFLSQVLMNWGLLLESHRPLVFSTLLALAGLAAWLAIQPGFRRWLLAQLWRLPAVGGRLKTYQLGRFYRSLGMLLRGGIPATTALAMAADLLPLTLKLPLERAAASVAEGQPFSSSMETHGLTTPVSARLLRVGERTGNLGEMMEHIASFHEDEMARWVDWFTRLFEPVLMACIGGIIGLIVVFMYLPIFELAGSLQ